ncbi:MAG TPA: methyl-accepting chemotaxis protein, partial [Herpetosiphonaceae bacterium]
EFLLTGNEASLASYNEGLAKRKPLLDATRALLLDTDQLAQLDEINAAIDTVNSQVFVPGIQARRKLVAESAGQEDVEKLEANTADLQQMAAIALQIENFQIHEQALLDARSDEAQTSASELKASTIGLAGTTIVLTLMISLLLANYLSRRLGLVAAAASGIAGGRLNETYAMPDGQDEIGTMARAFTTMAETLRGHLAEQQRANEELRAAAATQVAKDYIEEVVRSYSAFAAEVASGNLSTRLSVNGRQDELAQLGHSLNTMVERLHAITSQVQQTNAAIVAAATEILAATNQQASSANEQSAAIAQTSTTIEEIKAIAVQTAHQATQVAHDSQSALQVARQGTQAVEETVGGMGQIRQRVDSIAQTILGLAEQTQAIGEIITTVNQLSDQSNLLALNAAIEAARAGEQGKSFAVVAQHVRDLADRSKAATGQVRDILGEIQRATANAVLVTDEGTKGVETGARLAGEAGQVIHRIAAEVESGAQANVQMAAAAQQQTAGMDQIGQAMLSIQQATTQTLASTRQAERAATDLHRLAQALQQTIAAYQL